MSEVSQRYAADVYEQTVPDLHELLIPTDGLVQVDGAYKYTGQPLRDYSCVSSCGTVRVFLRDLEARLIEQIDAADYVYGCVAWLTSEPILTALARKGTQIVVQKEDVLRPDCHADSSWARRLRALYGALKNPIDRYEVPGVANYMSFCGDPGVEPVRCVGNHNADRNPAFPRSHHKFVIFGKYEAIDGDGPCQTGVRPYAVWTGSFNFTRNAGRSFENAVLMTDPVVIEAFEQEWSQILALSERLDWNSRWVSPQWRIGT